MTVPDEAVEAAAKALAIVAWGEWEYVPTELRGRMKRDARLALEAAAPFIAAQAWDEGSLAGWSDRTRSFMRRQTHAEYVANETTNPYRSAT